MVVEVLSGFKLVRFTCTPVHLLLRLCFEMCVCVCCLVPVLCGSAICCTGIAGHSRVRADWDGLGDNRNDGGGNEKENLGVA